MASALLPITCDPDETSDKGRLLCPLIVLFKKRRRPIRVLGRSFNCMKMTHASSKNTTVKVSEPPRRPYSLKATPTAKIRAKAPRIPRTPPGTNTSKLINASPNNTHKMSVFMGLFLFLQGDEIAVAPSLRWTFRAAAFPEQRSLDSGGHRFRLHH